MMPASPKKTGKKVRLPRPPLVRALWHSVLFLVLLLLGTYFLSSPQVAFLERQMFGMQMSIYRRCYGARADAARKQIVLVPIKDETFTEGKFKELKAPPLPRDYHAKVIDELRKSGASVIVFDLLFDLPSPHDRALADAAKKFKNLVWAASWQSIGGPNGGWLLPNPTLRSAVGNMGHTRTPHSEIDNAADRIEAFVSSPQGKFPALSLQAARMFRTLNPAAQQSGSGALNPKQLRVPLNKQGTFKIAYSGDPGHRFLSLPYETIWNCSQKNGNDSCSEDSPARVWVKNKIVIVGDDTTLGKDNSATPIGNMSGMEIHAQAIATLLQGLFLTDAGPIADLMTLLFLLAGAWLLAAKVSLRRVLPFGALLLSVFFMFNTWLFVEHGVDGAVVIPIFAAILMMVGVVVERGGHEEASRRRMSSVLDQYVSPQVGREGAPKGEVTLVFTDIESSSLLSERHGAAFEKARDDHFHLLREAARRWNGFEVETAGDSLFIVFADAADAVRFSVEGQLALIRHKWPLMAREVSGMYGPPLVPGSDGRALPVRIGMHTGTPFIGRDRTRFTYRGPATNRASRVMGAGHGGQILLSQSTWERAHEAIEKDENCADFYFIERGAYRLKGVGEDTLWEVCHADLFEPPPRPLRDSAVEEVK